MGRLEARNYMEKYSQASNQIPALMELAKLDFAMVQSMHQKELAEISIDLLKDLAFPEIDQLITSIVGTLESKIIERGVLSRKMIEKASARVDSLAKLKASRMKELVFKKSSELEEI
ncbi:putative terpene synthase 11 [Glycine max]|nr:putative terpene synthase 11 [Glycine max]